MKNNLYYFLIVCFLLFSCNKDESEHKIEDLNPRNEIVGVYDAKKHQSYTVGGTNQIFDEIIEVRKNGSNYDFYVDGYWNAKLNFKRVYDGVLYCTVAQHGGYWSESNSTFQRKGWFSPLADYTSSEVTFQMNNNNKLEICMKYYGIQNNKTKEPIGYDIIVFYVGNRR